MNAHSDATAVLRTANMQDVPALNALIAVSARILSAPFYNPSQIEALLTRVFGVDTQLVADGTYYVINGTDADGPVACGGWSARRTLYGGDQSKHGEDTRLDPAVDSARIRAFFVHPQWARQGLGRRLYTECETVARGAGFKSFELMATLPGVPLYATLGFDAIEDVTARIGDVDVPLVRMQRSI